MNINAFLPCIDCSGMLHVLATHETLHGVDSMVSALVSLIIFAIIFMFLIALLPGCWVTEPSVFVLEDPTNHCEDKKYQPLPQHSTPGDCVVYTVVGSKQAVAQSTRADGNDGIQGEGIPALGQQFDKSCRRNAVDISDPHSVHRKFMGSVTPNTFFKNV